MNAVQSHRLPALDGVRGLAISLVLAHHFFELTAPEPGLVDRVAFGVAESGWIGVDLFFVLSGFLITSILYDTRESARYFVNFYARRTLRIFPLYYATLFVLFIVLPLVPHPLAAEYVRDSSRHQGWFWTYLTNFHIASRGAWYDYLVPTVFWSLAIEEQFYLIWPLVVWSFTRQTLMRLCLALCVVALALRGALALGGVNPITLFVLTPARMDCLLLGGFLALIRRDDESFQRIARGAAWVAPALGLVLLGLALPNATLDWRDPLTSTLGFSAVALLCGGLLVLVVNAAPGAAMRQMFENRALRTLGQYSYAMYIFHGPAGTLVKRVYDVEHAPVVLGSELPRALLYGAIATLVTLAAAWCSWHLIERPFLSWQIRFRSAPAPSGAHENTGTIDNVAVHASR
jgi:peptidoglycan/LPS O-acetylase OafA/YrhL